MVPATAAASAAQPEADRHSAIIRIGTADFRSGTASGRIWELIFKGNYDET